jgi:hypothetical protein
MPLVSISNNQRTPRPTRAGGRRCITGCRAACSFPGGSGNYLAYLGWMSPEKRVDRAIEIARRAGMPLKIAAKIYPEE